MNEVIKTLIERRSCKSYKDTQVEEAALLPALQRPAPGKPALKSAVQKALAPFADPDASVAACLDYMQGRIDDVIVPLEGITAAQATALTDAITAAKNAVTDATIEKTALAALKSAVEAVENENAKAALTNDLYRAERIAMVLHADASSDDGAEDTAPTTAETPAGEDKDEGMSVTTIIIIVIVVIIAIISSAFGVAKLLAKKKA